MWFEPVPSDSEPCFPTHCAMGTIGFSEKYQWNHKNIWHDRGSNSELLLANFLSEIDFLIKRVGKNTLRKKEKVSTEWITLFHE